MLIVLAGRPTLRTLDGERQLDTGEVVAFPVGPGGAHRVDNHADEPARVLILSEMNAPDVIEYPDSDKVMFRGTPPGRGEDPLRQIVRRGESLDYFDGET